MTTSTCRSAPVSMTREVNRNPYSRAERPENRRCFPDLVSFRPGRDEFRTNTTMAETEALDVLVQQ